MIVRFFFGLSLVVIIPKLLVLGQKLNEMCDYWAYIDKQCAENTNFMWTQCRSSCIEVARAGISQFNEESADVESCDLWASQGECLTNPKFIQVHCPFQCGYGVHWNAHIRREMGLPGTQDMGKAGIHDQLLQQQPVQYAEAHKAVLAMRQSQSVKYDADMASRTNKIAYIRDYAERRASYLEGGARAPTAQDDGGGNYVRQVRTGVKVVSASLDLASGEVVPNPLFESEKAAAATNSIANSPTSGRSPRHHMDLYDAAESLRMRVQNVVHAGLHSDATLGLAMDAPSALHLAYGLYETILYSHKLYQVVVALVLQGVLDTAADSVSPSFALSAEAEQEGERRLLLEELIDLRDRLRSSSNSVLRVVDTDGYKGDLMTRTADEAVWSLKGVSGLVGDVILRCEETGILQLYKPFSNYLNESALEAGHKLLLSHFNVQRRHKDDNKDAKDIKVNAPVPVLTIGSRLHGGARATLSTGIVMPALAFGTWKLETTACELAVTRAIESGMRHIDSAQAYGNERWTGAGIRNALDSVPGLTRTDLFIATKLSMESESGGYEETNALIAQQMKDLRVTYLDMYYLHSPFRDQKLLVGSLTAIFEHILEGKIRALGLSNFDAVALDDLYSGAFGTAVQAATRTKDGSNKQRSGLNTEYLARLRPVVLQNKVDLYHTGRQFDNEGNDVRALALKYRLFLMGYSPFSGYPFALMPTWDPVLTMVASSYFATLSEADKAAEAKGGDGMSWAQVCVSDVDIDCSADDGKVQRAALLLQYQFKHLGAGAILRSVSRTSITTALFATSADMIPLSEEAMGALHTVQELIVTPLLKSTEFTFDGTL